MSHPIAPPRRLELILEALIPNERTRDLVLGDLAEEWVERSVDEGMVAATRWYRMQVAREIPRLLLAWLGQAGWIAVVATVAVGLVFRMLAGFAEVALIYPLARLLQLAGADTWLTTTFWLLGSAMIAFTVGDLVARIYRRAPLGRVCCLVLAFLVTFIFREAIDEGLVYAWFPLPDQLVSIPLVIAGTLHRYRRQHRSLGSAA